MSIRTIGTKLAQHLILPHVTHNCLVVAVGIREVMSALSIHVVDIAVWQGLLLHTQLVFAVSKVAPGSPLTPQTFHKVLAETRLEL